MSYCVAMSTQPGEVPVPAITFGDRVRRLRLNLHLTQDEFADTIGVGRATIGKYELLVEAPRTHRLMRNSLELRFGRDVAQWVMTGETRPHDGGGTTHGGEWVRRSGRESGLVLLPTARAA